MLTTKRETEYLEHGGGQCPGCSSTKLTAKEMELDGSQAYVEVVCDICGATWQDIYRLSGIDNFERGEVSECDVCGEQCPTVNERTNDDGETVMACAECADVIDSKDAKRMRD